MAWCKNVLIQKLWVLLSLMFVVRLLFNLITWIIYWTILHNHVFCNVKSLIWFVIPISIPIPILLDGGDSRWLMFYTRFQYSLLLDLVKLVLIHITCVPNSDLLPDIEMITNINFKWCLQCHIQYRNSQGVSTWVAMLLKQGKRIHW
jgi:hypothetical protein